MREHKEPPRRVAVSALQAGGMGEGARRCPGTERDPVKWIERYGDAFYDILFYRVIIGRMRAGGNRLLKSVL